MRAQHTSLEPTPAVKPGQESLQLLQAMERLRHLDMEHQQHPDTGHLHQAMGLRRLRMALHRHQHMDSLQLKTPMRSTSSLAR
jgi:hypothetical protein